MIISYVILCYVTLYVAALNKWNLSLIIVIPPSQVRLWYRPLSEPKDNIGWSLWKDMIWRINVGRWLIHLHRSLVWCTTRYVHLYEDDPLRKISNRIVIAWTNITFTIIFFLFLRPIACKIILVSIILKEIN